MVLNPFLNTLTLFGTPSRLEYLMIKSKAKSNGGDDELPHN